MGARGDGGGADACADRDRNAHFRAHADRDRNAHVQPASHRNADAHIVTDCDVDRDADRHPDADCDALAYPHPDAHADRHLDGHAGGRAGCAATKRGQAGRADRGPADACAYVYTLDTQNTLMQPTTPSLPATARRRIRPPSLVRVQRLVDIPTRWTLLAMAVWVLWRTRGAGWTDG
mgnify:CR=1 FL=1